MNPVKSTYKLFNLSLFIVLGVFLWAMAGIYLLRMFEYFTVKGFAGAAFLAISAYWFTSVFLRDSRRVTIDGDTITFTDLLSFKTVCRWTDFDYYHIVTETSKLGSEYPEAVWLIKDNRLQYRITGLFVKNFKDIKRRIKVENNGRLNMNGFHASLYMMGWKKRINPTSL